LSAARERRRSGVQTRELVLDSAEHLFAAKGYRATSLEEIGREAGLSRATPGYFFRSKDGLYGEMLARIFARAQVALAPAYERFRPDEPIDEALDDLVRAHLELLAREPALVRLIQWETLNDDARIVLELGSRARPLVTLIQELSEHIGPLRLDSARATALLIGIASLCWFPLAYADALEQAVGTDSRSRDAIDSQTQKIVEFVLSQVREQPVPDDDRDARNGTFAPPG